MSEEEIIERFNREVQLNMRLSRLIKSQTMSEEEIIERFNREVQLNMRLSRLIQKQYVKEAKEEKQRRIAIEQQLEKDVKDEKQRRFLVEQERDQLRKELEMWKEREQQSRLYSEKLVDQNAHLLQQINQLQTEMQKLRDEPQEQRRSTQQQKPEVTKLGQMQNRQDGNVSGKFGFIGNWLVFPDFLSSENVEYISYWKDNLDSLVPNISSYKKELLMWTGWKCMNASGYADNYANLLSLCRQWKRLRPDGEIHCLYYYAYGKGESPSEPDKELFSLLTTCNKYLFTWNDASDISAIRQYWPKFADSILSEQIKKKYPK